MKLAQKTGPNNEQHKILTLILNLSIFLALGIASHATPKEIAETPSPSNKFTASIKLVEQKDSGADKIKQPQLIITDNKTKEIIQVIELEVNDADDRDEARFEWSPDGRFIVVTQTQGQLHSFDIYQVKAHSQKPLAELSIPKQFDLKPIHERSRGGRSIEKWISPSTFIVKDTILCLRSTCRITKKNEIEVIGAERIDP